MFVLHLPFGITTMYRNPAIGCIALSSPQYHGGKLQGSSGGQLTIPPMPSQDHLVIQPMFAGEKIPGNFHKCWQIVAPVLYILLVHQILRVINFASPHHNALTQEMAVSSAAAQLSPTLHQVAHQRTPTSCRPENLLHLHDNGPQCCP